MSAIIFNAKNSKRFAKRLQKLLNQEFTPSSPLPLHICQDYLARVVGVDDWQRLNQLLEKTESLNETAQTKARPEFSGQNPLISHLMQNPAYRSYLEEAEAGPTFLMEKMIDIAERLRKNYSNYNFNVFLLHHIEKGWVLAFNQIAAGADYSFEKKDVLALYCMQNSQADWIFSNSDNDLNEKLKDDKILNYQIKNLKTIAFNSSLLLTEVRIEQLFQKMSKIHFPNINSVTLLHLASILSQNEKIVALSEKEIVVKNSERLFLAVTKKESDNQAIPYTVFESQWGHYHFNEDELSLGLHWHDNPEQALEFIKDDIDSHQHKTNLDDYVIMELLVPREEFLRSGNKQKKQDKIEKWKTIFIDYHRPALLEHIDSAYQNPKHSKNRKKSI